jgi:hypothetical protein
MADLAKRELVSSRLSVTTLGYGTMELRGARGGIHDGFRGWSRNRHRRRDGQGRAGAGKADRNAMEPLGTRRPR